MPRMPSRRPRDLRSAQPHPDYYSSAADLGLALSPAATSWLSHDLALFGKESWRQLIQLLQLHRRH